MIFAPVLNCKPAFNFASLEAINIYAYFKMHSLEDCKAGIGCTVQEFNVNPTLLDLAIYLNYTPSENITTSILKDFANAIEADPKLTIFDPDDVTGAQLIYLILAQHDSEFSETFTDEAYEVLTNIKKLIGLAL